MLFEPTTIGVQVCVTVLQVSPLGHSLGLTQLTHWLFSQTSPPLHCAVLLQPVLGAHTWLALHTSFVRQSVASTQLGEQPLGKHACGAGHSAAEPHVWPDGTHTE